MKRIAVYVPECAVIEAITPPYRLFKTANDFLQAQGKEPMFEVEYVALKRSVHANDGEYAVKVNRLLLEVNETDLIFLPAIYGDVDNALKQNARAIPWLKEMYARGSEIASLCVGAFLLAATGLLDGKKCSTHWAYYSIFREKYPEVVITDGSVITDEGRIYSSGGANSLWNLLLYLLEKYTNRQTAVLAAKYFAIDISRNSQSDFSIFTGQKTHSDTEILKAQEIIEKNFSEKISVNELADQVNISRRNFERRFKLATNNTPIEYIQRVRIESAKRCFEGSRQNVNEVMYAAGYTDTKAFRDIFKRITGLTPLAYRNKYARLQMNNHVYS